MSRRPSPAGHFSLFRRKNHFWYYYIYDHYGVRHQYSTGCTSKTDALTYVIHAIDSQTYAVPPKKRVMTLSAFAEGFYGMKTSTYIEDRIARGYKYSEKLARSNASALERHVIKYLGDRPVCALTSSEVNRWLLDLPKKENISNKTANTSLTILRQVLDEAVRQGIIDRNCASCVRPLNKNAMTTERQVRRVAFSTDQIRKLFAFEWENRHAMIMCMLSAGTGMRIGEVRALTAEQIHDDYIEVSASIAEFEGRKSTKSGHPRIVPIDMGLHYMLEEIMPDSGGYLFTLDGVHPVSDNWVSRALKAQMEKVGIRAEEGEQLSFHSFRHYFNTRLVAGNIKPEKVRAVIGHESEAMTDHYTHLESCDLEEIRAIQRLAIGL